MKIVRRVAVAILITVFAGSMLASVLAPAGYAMQFREATNASPSRQFLLGTDELGRDRFSRLLYGTRITLLLAPAAALLATLVAALIGGIGGYLGGWWERAALAAIDLFLSLPWLFLLLTIRALLPLNIAPLLSVVATFTLLGILGWAPSARLVCAGTRALRESDFMLLARANGNYRYRLLFKQILPNLKPVLYAQFMISIPIFILAEANLGVLGLGVSEPLPSWGNLLRELENYSAVPHRPWMLAPPALLVLVVSCFHLILSAEEL